MVLITAGGLSVTVTVSPSHPSSHSASPYRSSWAADVPLFIKWNGAWNSEFSFVYTLTLAHNWLLERFLSHCHTDDLLALMEGKSSFRWSAVMLCLAVFCVCQEIRLEKFGNKGSIFVTNSLPIKVVTRLVSGLLHMRLVSYYFKETKRNQNASCVHWQLFFAVFIFNSCKC